jgi:hypothetical protein
VEDDPRSGQPITPRTDADVDRVGTLAHSDRRLSVRLIAEEGYENLVEEVTLWSDKWILNHDYALIYDALRVHLT